MPARSPENTKEHVPPRLADGRWAPGACPNPGGRPKAIADVRELARQHTATAIAKLATIAENGKTEMACIAAATALLDRGWGRPTQPIAGDDDMPPIAVSVEDRDRQIAERRAEARKLIDDAFGEPPAPVPLS